MRIFHSFEYMKNTIFNCKSISLLATCFILGIASSYPIAHYSRTKDKCGFGCGEVSKNKDLITYIGPDGKKFKAWSIDIKCSGAGINHCPRKLSQNNDIETWSANTFRYLSHYAQKQTDIGIKSGDKLFHYILPDQSHRVFRVTWKNFVNEADEQSIYIDINQINR